LSVKDFFSKVGFIFSCLGALLVALFLGKNLHDNGKRTEADSGRDKPTDTDSREAGESKKRIFDIIERVKARERGTESKSENL
jgi:hypothetical protein